MSYDIVDIKDVYEKKQLNASLLIPSASHSNSICVEFMSNWFKGKFDKSFFKSEYINGENIINGFRNKEKSELLKRMNPALAIRNEIDFSFDRDKVDSIMNGVDMYVKRSKYEDSFYKDLSKDLYLGLSMKLMLINFTFKLRLNTRSQQIDLYDYMKMNFRVGYTHGVNTSLDFHIPNELMKMIAKDSGFKTDSNGNIVHILDFLQYVNSNSIYPIIYKYRNINGNNEFFIRFPDVYVHISTPDITLDDGVRNNQVEGEFGIELMANVRFPAPKFYVYYSESKHLDILVKEHTDNAVPIYSTRLTSIPNLDDHNWNLLLTTEIADDDLKSKLEVNFEELFDTDSDIFKAIKYTRNIQISPAVFMNFKLYNLGEEVEYYMNWETLVLTSKNLVKEEVTVIGIYIDNNYVSNVKINIENIYENRLQ